jgi:periplasmic divalent cation tolerance protein
MVEYIQMITTVEKREDAKLIARHLVEKRAAACVQVVGPIESTYWWEGVVEEGQEWQCLIKTKKHHFETVRRLILDVHPYEVPEIIAFPVEMGNREYLDWVSQELR